MSLLGQTLDNFIQIEAEMLGHRKKLLNRLSRRALFDSFIIFYHGSKLMAELLGIWQGYNFEKGLRSAGWSTTVEVEEDFGLSSPK